MVNIKACAVIKPVAIPPSNVRMGFTMGKSLMSAGRSRNRYMNPYINIRIKLQAIQVSLS
jgi:hypothetical protein